MSNKSETKDTVRQVTAESSRDLRHRVLRPTETTEQIIARELPDSHYAGVERDGDLVAVGWVRPEGSPGEWRVGSMATDVAHRKQGLAALVISTLTEHAREKGAKRVWCNARMAAIGFYESQGWAIASDEPIQIDGAGEHRRMARELTV